MVLRLFAAFVSENRPHVRRECSSDVHAYTGESANVVPTPLYSSAVRRALIALLPFLAACGSSSSPSAPSPVPVPSSITITATIADTVTGAVIGSSVQSVNGLPAQLTIARAGYVTRQTWVSSAEPRIDLFPEAGFDLTFYRQFARGSLDGAVQPLRVLAAAPSIYLQTAGLSAATVAALETAAREAVPAFSGGRFALTTWETGAEARTPRAGWITVELVNDPAQNCGRATIGAAVNQLWLNLTDRCGPSRVTGFAHELGHALGFWHVTAPDGLMLANAAIGAQPSPLERHHAALAYTRSAGNTDVDSDPRVPSTFQTLIVVD